MPGKIDLYNLSNQGVDLTRTEIHADDGSFQSAQNALPDKRGEYGGVAKRDGLVAINSVAAAGTVTGAILVPLSASLTRTFYVDGGTVTNWETNTDEFTSGTSPVSTPSTGTRNVGLTGHLDQSHDGRMISTGRLLVFPGNHVSYPTASHEAPPIRSWDGTVDRIVATIPPNTSVGAGTNAKHIYDMLLDGSRAFVISHDSDTTNAMKGRVFKMDMTTFALTQLGERFGADSGEIGSGTVQPLCLAMHEGYLYVGTGEGTKNQAATGKVYRIQPDSETAWTLDGTFTARESVTTMVSYKGLLYAGTQFNLNATEANVMVRSAAGVWTVSDSSSGTTGANSRYGAATVFGENLYIGQFRSSGSTSYTIIRKFDNTTWSTALTIQTDVTTPRLPWASVVHNSRLYYLTTGGTSPYATVYHTSNGTSWSTQSTGLPTGSMTNFFGVLPTA